MLTKYVPTLAFILIALTSCSLHQPTHKAKQVKDLAWEDTEFEVYQALFNTEDIFLDSPVLIIEHTRGGTSNYTYGESDFSRVFPESSSEVRADFEHKNVKRLPIPPIIYDHVDAVLVPIQYETQIAFGFNGFQDDWLFFQDETVHNNNFVMTISRVGLNPDEDEAIIYADRLVVTDDGRFYYGVGDLYYFKKITGVWEIIAEAEVWIT